MISEAANCVKKLTIANKSKKFFFLTFHCEGSLGNEVVCQTNLIMENQYYR